MTVAVPETAMNEDDAFQPRKYKVRLAGQGVDVQTVSETEAMNQPADGHLRTRVLTLDAAHPLTALLGC